MAEAPLNEQVVGHPSERDEHVLRLHEEGKSERQTAAITGVPKSTVGYIIRKYRLERKGRDEREEDAKINERLEAVERKVSDLEQELKSLVNALRDLQLKGAPPTPRPTVQSSAEGGENPTLRAFDMFEQGMGPLEVVRSLNMDVETVKSLLSDWKAVKEAYEGATPRGGFVFSAVGKVMGENLRDVCDHFNAQSGVCTLWHLTEIDDALRKGAPGLVKVVGGKARWNVSLHPEVCALCTYEWLQERMKARQRATW